MKLHIVAASLVVVLAQAGVAAATPPETTTQQFGSTFTDTFTCGFPLQVTCRSS